MTVVVKTANGINTSDNGPVTNHAEAKTEWDDSVLVTPTDPEEDNEEAIIDYAILPPTGLTKAVLGDKLLTNITTDTLTYKVSVDMPDDISTYADFVLSDTLPTYLTLAAVANPVIIQVNGTDVTSLGTVSPPGGNPVEWTITGDTNLAQIAGETVEMILITAIDTDSNYPDEVKPLTNIANTRINYKSDTTTSAIDGPPPGPGPITNTEGELDLLIPTITANDFLKGVDQTFTLDHIYTLAHVAPVNRYTVPVTGLATIKGVATLNNSATALAAINSFPAGSVIPLTFTYVDDGTLIGDPSDDKTATVTVDCYIYDDVNPPEPNDPQIGVRNFTKKEGIDINEANAIDYAVVKIIDSLGAYVAPAPTTLGGSPVSGNTVVDLTDLAKVNAGLQGETIPLKFSYYDSLADKTVTATAIVEIMGEVIPPATDTPLIGANSFFIGQGYNLTLAEAIDLAKVAEFDRHRIRVTPNTDNTAVDATQLAAVIAAKQAEVKPLTFFYTDNNGTVETTDDISVNVTVRVVIKGGPIPPGPARIGADHFEIKEGYPLTPTEAIVLARVLIKDSKGAYDIPVDALSGGNTEVDAAQLATVIAAKQGQVKPLKFTYTDRYTSQKVNTTINVTIKGDGPDPDPDPDAPTIGADHFIIKEGYALSPTEAITLAKVIEKDSKGVYDVPVDALSGGNTEVDADQLDAIIAAKQGEVKPLKFTYTDPYTAEKVSATVNVTIKGDGPDPDPDPDAPTIGADHFIIKEGYALTPTEAITLAKRSEDRRVGEELLRVV
jgi:fimbrial isopeptide formation D2 family protein